MEIEKKGFHAYQREILFLVSILALFSSIFILQVHLRFLQLYFEAYRLQAH